MLIVLGVMNLASFLRAVPGRHGQSRAESIIHSHAGRLGGGGPAGFDSYP